MNTNRYIMSHFQDCLCHFFQYKYIHHRVKHIPLRNHKYICMMYELISVRLNHQTQETDYRLSYIIVFRPGEIRLITSTT